MSDKTDELIPLEIGDHPPLLSLSELLSEMWISVNDNLPEEDQFVLIYIQDMNPNIRVGWYSTHAKNWISPGAILSNVTHWMRLPGPPKE